MNILQFNKLAYLHDNKHIFFCKMDRINVQLEMLKLHKFPCSLITGNSDLSVTKKLIETAESIPCIKNWYGQNMCVDDSKISHGIPIGIDNSEECILAGHGIGFPHIKEKIKLLSLKRPVLNKKDRNIYANFNIRTNPRERNFVANICESSSNIDCHILGRNKNSPLSIKDYYNTLAEYKMVVCPEGNGIDTVRAWETLYLGSVPIIKKSKAMNFFRSLPIVFVEDWVELNNIQLIYSKYTEVKNNSRSLCDTDYWKSKILNEIQPYI